MRKKEGEYNCFDGHFRVTDTPWPFSVTRRQTPRSAAPPPSPCTVTARRLREGPPPADGPGAEACSACHSTHVHWYKPDTVTEMEQKETERWQKTKTKNPAERQSRDFLAHLGIWLWCRRWSSGHPSLLYTFSTNRGGEARRAVIRQVQTCAQKGGKPPTRGKRGRR